MFTQNFSSSNTTSDYVASPAGPNQFDNLPNGGPTGNPTNAFAVVDGALQSTKTGATSAAINRVTPLPTAGKAASFQFALSVSNAATSQSANDLIFQVGNALSNGTNQGTGIYQQYNIDLQGGTSFNVAGLGGNFSGTQTITLDLNNSGSTVNFSTPGGGTLALANDNFAIFVGATNIIPNGQIAVGTGGTGDATLDITEFRLRYQSSGDNATVAVDNFVVTVVPEPSTYVLLGMGLAGLGAVIARRRRSAC